MCFYYHFNIFSTKEHYAQHRLDVSHLSKWPCDLKINGTQENVTFSDQGFYGLPCGVLLFDATVSFRNHKIEAPDWLLKNSSHS